MLALILNVNKINIKQAYILAQILVKYALC